MTPLHYTLGVYLRLELEGPGINVYSVKTEHHTNI